MNRRTLVVLVAALAFLAVVAAIVLRGAQTGNRDQGLLVPGLKEQLNGIQRIVVLGPGNAPIATLERGAKNWTVVERSNYAADVGRIRRNLLALAEARRTEALAPFFAPPNHRDNPDGARPTHNCPGGGGGVNITGPPAADPSAGVIFITSTANCFRLQVAPGKEYDNPKMTGTTVSPWAAPHAASVGGTPPLPPDSPLRGIPSIFKGYLGRITAIDLHTGEHLWVIPHGETALEVQEAFGRHPLMKGLTFETNLGRQSHAALMATPTLLFATGQTADSKPHVFAIDKKTGRRVAAVPTPALGQYGLMTYLHQGKQYIILPVQGGYTALALP